MFRTTAFPSSQVHRRPSPRDSDYGLVSDTNTTRDDIATAHYKHDFSPDLSIADTLRYAHYEFDYQSAMPNFGTTPPTATTPLASILVGRDMPGQFRAFRPT